MLLMLLSRSLNKSRTIDILFLVQTSMDRLYDGFCNNYYTEEMRKMMDAQEVEEEESTEVTSTETESVPSEQPQPISTPNEEEEEDQPQSVVEEEQAISKRVRVLIYATILGIYLVAVTPFCVFMGYAHKYAKLHDGSLNMEAYGAFISLFVYECILSGAMFMIIGNPISILILYGLVYVMMVFSNFGMMWFVKSDTLSKNLEYNITKCKRWTK